MTLLALLLLVADSSRTIERELPAEIARVAAFHAFGDLIVHATAAGERPHARLDLAASGESQDARRRYLEQCELSVEDEPLTIRSLFPPTEEKPADVSFAATLTLWLPIGASVELSNSYGQVSVEGRDGDVKIVNRMGEVTTRRVRGSVEIEQQFAPVTAEDVGGDLVVRGKSVPVVARAIGGHVDVRTSGAPVRVEGAGSAYVETSLHPLVLLRVKGDASLHSSFCDVSAREIGGSLGVEGGNGTFAVENVGKDLTLRTRFAPVRVNGVGGNAIVENSTRALELANARGDVEASAHGGLLKASWSRLPAGEKAPHISLESESGGIELELPDGASAAVELATTSGPIECALPGMTAAQIGATRTGKLKLGAGTAAIHATSVGGAIRVRRASTH